MIRLSCREVLFSHAPRVVVCRPWDDSLLQEAVSLLLEDLPLDPGAPGGMIEYRRTLTLSFFFKFYLQVCGWLSGKVDDSCKTVLETFHRPTPASTQLFQVVRS